MIVQFVKNWKTTMSGIATVAAIGLAAAHDFPHHLVGLGIHPVDLRLTFVDERLAFRDDPAYRTIEHEIHEEEQDQNISHLDQ